MIGLPSRTLDRAIRSWQWNIFPKLVIAVVVVPVDVGEPISDLSCVMVVGHTELVASTTTTVVLDQGDVIVSIGALRGPRVEPARMDASDLLRRLRRGSEGERTHQETNTERDCGRSA